MFSKFFINRPIFATVLALLIVVAGLVTLGILPIAQYPDITPPTVQVSAVYPGANAQTVAQTVGIPIEQQVNGVEGMLYMSSNSSSSGAYSLTITFADQACATWIRPYVERMRPSNLNNPISEMVHIVNNHRGGRYGFPSCHAANTFGLAFFLFFLFRKRWLTLFIMA